MIGATLAVATGAQRRHGWAAVVLAALAAMFPDWDAATERSNPRAYQQGHRFWGHNLFAVTAAGATLGWLGHLIHRSRSRRSPRPPTDATDSAGPWVVLGVAVMLSHPLMDLLYCGLGREADWPVGLFWPVVPAGFALPWMPWSDRGATAILLAGLCVCLLVRRHRQGFALVVLAVLGLYVGVRGAVLQWG
jgi:hypothetical protein